ncbi:polysaccharide deacetylase family protein [Leadbettera azotonutricia]|nr:polysaccharide deacetylase family protein [Leadbettera azotonutricia]
MKNIRIITPLLLLLAFLSACAGRPAIRQEALPEDSLIEEIPPPEVIIPVMERIALQVKRNGDEITKYFVLDDEGDISVMAEISDPTGDYSIVYDLGAEDLRVRFKITEKETEAFLEDSFIWIPSAGSAGILLGFDDDYMETWEQYFDLFAKYDAKVTFFVQGEFCPFCLEALKRGHDVGYHTLHHKDLRKLTRDIFMEETVSRIAAFREAGVPLSSFAYPFGFSEPWMHQILLEHFALVRGYGTTYRLYDEEGINTRYISSRAIDNTVIKGDEHFDRSIALMLRTVKFLGKGFVLPLTTHTISESAAWGISPRRLEYLLKTAGDLKLNFYLYSDFAKDRSVSPVTR